MTFIIGKQKMQRLFDRLHSYALEGMNIGGNGKVEGSGENNVLLYIKQKIKIGKQSIIFDVGANIGAYSILLHNVFSNNAKIYAFEPSKKTFRSLSANIEFAKNVIAYNHGFGDQNTMHQLFSNADDSGLASVYQRRLEHFSIQMNQVEDIELQTIDAFCLKNDIHHIDFLKMDVEGHEIKVLNGAIDMITNGRIDFIQFEFGGCNIDSKTFFQDFYYLLKEKYKIYRILKDELYEIESYNERLEIFVTANYLAEKKTLLS